jgi:hypothetical protein
MNKHIGKHQQTSYDKHLYSIKLLCNKNKGTYTFDLNEVSCTLCKNINLLRKLK